MQAYLELAVDYGNCGMYGEAIDVLRQAVAASPDKAEIDPMIHYHTGLLLVEGGQ